MSLHLSKCHIVGNHMSRLNIFLIFTRHEKQIFLWRCSKTLMKKNTLMEEYLYILGLLNQNICKIKCDDLINFAIIISTKFTIIISSKFAVQMSMQFAVYYEHNLLL